jgi:GNAT superfamily N-acetyltransferase
MSEVEIVPLLVPSVLDSPDASDFLGQLEVRNVCWLEVVGTNELAVTPEEMLPRFQDAFEPISGFVARVGGRVVGRSLANWPAADGAPEASLIVEVHPDFRRRGIGTALLATALNDVRGRDKWIVQRDFMSTVVDGAEKLVAPTGFGSIDRGDPGAEFALVNGFSLEQIERFSRLRLPVDREVLKQIRAESQGTAGTDYRPVSWIGSTPEHWVDDVAALRTRMSTDAPTAALAATEDVWTPERVRASDVKREASGLDGLMTAVEHVPTGTLIGFSELWIARDLAKPAQQTDTLVLREHRGHRLGMLTKATNLLLLEDTFPGHSSVVTFNAEENRPMLDVNEALGFEPAGYMGVWKREFPRP